jgi:uncharacterized protein (TIGR02611 family)
VLAEVTEPAVVRQGEAWIVDHFTRAPVLPTVDAASRWQRWLIDPLGRIVARMADVASRIIVSRRRNHASADVPSRSATVRLARKAIAAVTGSTVLGFGIALVVLPGPAFLVIPLGLAILATEFLWARHLLDWLKTRVRAKGQTGSRRKSA